MSAKIDLQYESLQHHMSGQSGKFLNMFPKPVIINGTYLVQLEAFSLVLEAQSICSVVGSIWKKGSQEKFLIS